MLTHNTHYATLNYGNRDRGRIVGYAVLDIRNSKFLTFSGGWSTDIKKADLIRSRQILKGVYPENCYVAHPVFASDDNIMAFHGWGCS